MLTATCHCGALRIEVPRKPSSLTSCNCSICRRYGTLWAYYKASTVRVLGRTRIRLLDGAGKWKARYVNRRPHGVA